MKRILFITLALVVLTGTVSLAQNKLSVGAVVTRFDNIGDESRMTEIKTPVGFGIIGGYNLSKDITVAITLEYFKGDIEGINGTESDYRGHVSAYYHPVSFAGFRPYISGGLVVSNKSFSFDFVTNLETSKTNIYGRFGCGIDYSLFANLSANADLGFYNDGSKIAGWSQSIGLRLTF